MIKKISLYFDPYAWESLHRLVSLLLVSGKPLNELPNMNDVIEGTVIYVSRMLELGSPSSLRNFKALEHLIDLTAEIMGSLILKAILPLSL